MQVSDWWMLVSFYQNVLAIPLAVVLLVVIVRARTLRRRLLWAALVPVVLLPNIQTFAGNLYFDHLCRTQAGEFIYRTVDNVEGILQMRPRDGSKDYFDRMRAGDIPEDPWGHTNREAQFPWHMVGPYKFLEVPVRGATAPPQVLRGTYDVSMFAEPSSDAKVARFYGYDGSSLKSFRKEYASRIESSFGFTWKETSRWFFLILNIHRGEIHIVELDSAEVVAKKVGFYRVRPHAICPTGKDDSLVQTFLHKVLRPASHIGEIGR